MADLLTTVFIYLRLNNLRHLRVHFFQLLLNDHEVVDLHVALIRGQVSNLLWQLGQGFIPVPSDLKVFQRTQFAKFGGNRIVIRQTVAKAHEVYQTRELSEFFRNNLQIALREVELLQLS